MGMYDSVQCDYPLPGNEHPAPRSGKPLLFQTKDLLNLGSLFIINEVGELKLRLYDHESETIDYSPFHHTGRLSFYTHDHHPRRWFEYRARFKSGQLLSIEGGAEPFMP